MNNYTFKTEEKDNITIIRLSGYIDLSNSPILRKKLAEAINNNANILIDLSEVTYMDSSGLATLVEAMQKLNKNKGSLKISGLTGEVKNIFEIARLNDVFSIYEDIQSATSSF